MKFRTLLVVALAALVSMPAAVSAQSRKTTTPRRTTSTTSSAGAQGLTIGGQVGYESGDLGGLALRVDGEMPIQKLTPKIALSFVGSVGYSRLGQDYNPYPGVSGDLTWNVLSLIPAARFSMPVAPQISLYGDAGLGLYYGSMSASASGFGTTVSASDSTVGFMMRLGLGGMYEVNPKFKLSAEIGVKPYFGDADTTNFTIGIGGMFGI